MFWLPTLNFYMALGGLALGAVTLVLYFDYFFCKGKYFSKHVNKLAWGTIIAVTTGSVIMSLVYSEYFGFVPCSLCWLQRIALYPQALLSVMAFKINDVKNFTAYGIALSGFGFLVAIYQYLYQMVPQDKITAGVLPCLADGSADCADKVINEFGFMTFPLLSAITFAFLIVVYLYMRRQQSF